MAGETQRRLAAIVLADVVGYSRLMGLDDSGTLEAMRSHREALWDPTIEQYGGRIVNRAGDSALVEFSSAVAAMECAVAIQNGMAERNAGVPDDKRIQLRVGVNIGEVIVDGEEIYGDGVNIAARLQTLAAPGGIALSGNVQEQIRNKLDLPLIDGGEHEVKNITDPVRVWRWSAGGTETAPASPDPQPALPSKPSIAVLPFDNMSPDPEQEFFADGMTEDIITGLSRFPALFVIARNTAFTYKGQAVDLAKVARDLGVRYVLEGSVRKAGARVRITAQLIDAGTNNHLWAERYDRQMDDIFAIQDEVTDAIVATIAPEIGRAERRRAQRRQTEDLDAWSIYQRGLAAYYLPTPASLHAAIGLFDKATALDPSFAHAYAMAAETRSRVVRQDPSVDHDARLADALELSRKAISLEPRDPLCLAVHGHVLSSVGHHEAAISTLQEAVALNPNDATFHHWLGRALTHAGRAEEAVAEYDHALRLSPHDPYVASFHIMRSTALFNLGRYDESTDAARLATESPSPPFWAFALFAAGLSKRGRMDEQQAALAELYRRAPDFSLEFARRTYQHVRPDLQEAFVDIFRAAGVPD